MSKQIDVAARATVKPDEPCPNGCTHEWPNQDEPELVVADDDGELSCPKCWGYFGNLFALPGGSQR